MKEEDADAEQEDAEGVGEGDHRPEEERMFQGSAAAHEVSRDDGFAMAGGEGVHGTEPEGGQEPEED